MNKTTRCPYCKKYFFIINNNYKCPHCGKLANNLDYLKDLFGINDPFDNDTFKFN